jgi:hypothetical protein
MRRHQQTPGPAACRRLPGVLIAVLAGTGVLLAGGPACAASHPPQPAASSPAAASRVASPVLSVPGPTPSGAPSAPATPPGIVLLPTTPASSTTPAVPGGSVSSGGGGCGLFDVSCHVTSAINGWFKGLVTSALNPVLSLLGHTVLASPDVTGPGQVRDLWGAAAGIANTIVVLFVIVGGAIVMGHETLQTRYAAKDIAPRVVVAVIAANASLAVVGIGIGLANSLSTALLGPGVNPSNATAVLTRLVTEPLASGGIFLVLLGLVAAVLGVVLLAVYVIRVALLILLVAVAPIALTCHALPQTDGLARLWWRAIAGLLAIQVGQAVVLITALRVFFTSDGHTTLGLTSSGGLVDILVAICLLYILIRIPGWVSKAVFAGTGHTPGSAARAVKTVVVYKALRAGMAALA